MEPLLLSDGFHRRLGLTDLSLELAAASAGLRRSLPSGWRSQRHWHHAGCRGLFPEKLD
jgi:hypothetical protein